MKLLVSLTLSAVVSCYAALAYSAADRYVVVFQKDTLDAKSSQAVEKSGGKVARALPQIGVIVASGDARFAAAVSKQPEVLAVSLERSYALPPMTAVPADLASGPEPGTDLFWFYQWDIRRIGAPAAWARLAGMSYPQPKVAVLDTGVMHDHPDLDGQVCAYQSTAYCPTPGGSGNQISYPIYASLIDFNAYPNWTPADGCTPAPANYQWHGTHVAGTIAAKFGGGRVVGVAPDACVAAYKVFDRYRYTNAAGEIVEGIGAFDGPLLGAIIDAADKGVPVISMSLGGYLQRNVKGDNATYFAWDRVMKYANRAGALIVASAGNEAVDLNGNLVHIPSDFPTVVSTSATGSNDIVWNGDVYDAAPGSDTLASYSNFGASVNIAAPGGDCTPDDCALENFIVNAGISPSGLATYYAAIGTSMATPHVSAVAAYVRALHPTWTPGAVRAFLKSTAEPIGPRQTFGGGMVDADTATQ